MRPDTTSFIAFFICGFIACSPVKVRTQSDPKTDFSQYQTWCWLKGCELVYEGPSYLNDSATIEDIGNAIAVEMYNKGYQQVDDGADLLLDFHLVVKEDSAIFARVHEEDLPFWTDYDEEYYHFLRGSLIIDIIDRSRSQVVWRSNAESYMALYPDIDKKMIDQGVKKALKKFPKRELYVSDSIF